MADLVHGLNMQEVLQKKRVLVTGGVGFIGSNLAHRLVELGAEVTLVDSLIPEYGGNLFNIDGIRDKVTLNISDVRDEHSMKYLVQGHDMLFNLAGQTSHLDSMKNPFIDLEINATAQLSILEACRRYNRNIKIVFASTRQVYGRPEYLPVDEKHVVRPVDVNGINKTAGEWYHILYNNVYGIRSAVLRLTNTYGPRMRVKDSRQTFLGVWIRAVVEKESIEVWGGDQLRDFTYVDDAVEALLMAAASDDVDGRVFNLGGSETIALANLAEELTGLGGGEYVVRQFPDERKQIDIGSYYSDDSLIREALGWQPKTSLREGLRRALDFYGKHLAEYV